ncbi:hypothetical protein TrRE_jg5259, partial [Triparma retinervis]
HGYPDKDYTLLKLVTRNDTLHSGVYPTFPIDSLTPSQSARHLVSKGFTLVLNKLHRRSPTIHALTSHLTSLLNFTSTVSANLYLTPPSSTGFEPHYDYMDVLVLHLSPTPKSWTVHLSPSQVHPTSLTKAPPSPSHLSLSPSSNVTLSQGDMLYIPSGFVHHASNASPGGDAVHVTFGFELSDDDRVGGLFMGGEGGRGCVEGMMGDAEGGETLRKPILGMKWEDYREGIRTAGEKCKGGKGIGEEEWRWEREIEIWGERRKRERREQLDKFGEELKVKIE